jgi:hypothetical protein
MRRAVAPGVIAIVLATGSLGCATLERLRALVQAPQFSEADDRRAEIRLLGPNSDIPLGGAAIRLWTRVRNPNTFGLTLTTLRGSLFLEGSRAAEADFPLGLPLTAGGDEVIPLDLRVSFSDVPGLAGAIRRAVAGDPLRYRLNGTVGVDAHQFGTPTFGPMDLLTGEIRPLRGTRGSS